MIMLLVLRCLDVPRGAGADGASEATLGEASPVRLQAIFQAPWQTRRRKCDIPNDLPSGKHTKNYGKSPFQWENPL
jgi:hypothetical protein